VQLVSNCWQAVASFDYQLRRNIMAKSFAIKFHFAAELPNFIELFARKFRTLKIAIVFGGRAEVETALTDWQKYDSGDIDLRPIAHYSITQCDHQNSLDAMLMRGF
jgi:hypothetical protein